MKNNAQTKKMPPVQVRRPANWNIEAGKELAEVVIRENQDWLKEMANR